MGGSPEQLLRQSEEALQTNPSRAAELAREVLTVPQLSQNLHNQALLLLGTAEYHGGNVEVALQLLRRLRQQLSGSPDYDSRIKALLMLGRVERDSADLEAAGEATMEALRLAKQHQRLEVQVDAINLLAGLHSIQGDNASALDYLHQALEVAERHGYEARQPSILSNMGRLYRETGEYAKALEVLQRAYVLFKKAGVTGRNELTTIVNMGLVSLDQGHIEQARELFRESLEKSRLIQDLSVEAVSTNNLADIERKQRNLEAAQKLFEEALSKARQLGSRQYEVDNLDGLGQVYMAQGEHARALETYRQTLAIAREIGDQQGVADVLLSLGRAHLAVGDFGAALGALQEALELSQRLGSRRSVYEAHQLLCEAHKGRRDPERALHHFEQFHHLKEQVFGEEGERKTRQLHAQVGLERARYQVQIAQGAKAEAEALVARRTAELEQTQLEVLSRLALAAEYRDDQTGQHTWRVGQLSATIARRLGWSEAEAGLLAQAARLHDVGKIGIADAILNKPGRFTPEEFEQMKLHTSIGAMILSGGQSRLLRMAEEIAHAHHERWDGRGYPRGLSGEQIPQAARIVAVVDVYDALISERPYKPAWSRHEALCELTENSGSQFDPAVVAAFTAALPDGLEPAPDAAVANA